MTIPEKLRILFKEYDVKYADGMRNEKGDMLYGEVDYVKQTVTLNSAASDEQAKSTVLHEVIHALDELYIIGLKEKQVEKLGVAFYMFIRDNPDMFREEVAG